MEVAEDDKMQVTRRHNYFWFIKQEKLLTSSLFEPTGDTVVLVEDVGNRKGISAGPT